MRYKIIYLLLLFQITLFGLEITPKSTSILASDTYGDIDKFLKNYKGVVKKYEIDKFRYYSIDTSKEKIIAFRGTANLNNLITDIKAIESNFLDTNIKIHKGFYDIAKSVDNSLSIAKNKKVVLVGHSLGGAVALIYGAILKEQNYQVEVYSFGMPPVADYRFDKRYKGLSHHRYFHIFDPIPMLYKPTIETFQKQLTLKAYIKVEKIIDNLIKTIKNTPNSFEHHGVSYKLTNKLYQSKDDEKQSLFFKTLSLPFYYHKIDNYIYALSKQTSKYIETQYKPYEIFVSSFSGTIPHRVEFYINPNDSKISSYYFNFAGKEMIKNRLKDNKISYNFRKAGKHKVIIAIKDRDNKIKKYEYIISTREPTFEEYKERIDKDFRKFKENNTFYR